MPAQIKSLLKADAGTVGKMKPRRGAPRKIVHGEMFLKAGGFPIQMAHDQGSTDQSNPYLQGHQSDPSTQSIIERGLSLDLYQLVL